MAQRRHSLRQRLLISVGAVLGTTLLLLTAALFYYARATANEAYDRLLTGAALAILERSAVGPDGPTVDIPYSALQMVELMQEDRVFYRVIGPKGETVTGTYDLPLPRDFEPSDAPRYFDATYRSVTMRFAVQGRRVALRGGSEWIAVQIGDTRIARQELQRQVILRGLLGLVLLAGVGLLSVRFAINRALRPLVRIEREQGGREHTDLTPLSAEPPREIESLIAAINAFMARLQIGQERAQGFIADVAHQTRTSLTALQGHLELASARTDPEDMRLQVQKAEHHARRTVRLTSQLLSHAMVIHRADNEPMQQVRLDQILRTVIEEALRSTMAAQAIEFELAIADEAREADLVLGDPIALREALRNLVDNAIKHGPPTNSIRVSLTRIVSEGRARLRVSVEDAGPGIPPGDHAKALERFRTLEPGRGGSGLGLAIVKAVAASHAATLTLGTSSLGGLSVTLDFAALEA